MTDNYQGPGVYRHYKGADYQVLGLALQEDDFNRTYVIYRPLTPGSLLEYRPEQYWARELSDFNATVATPGKERTLVPRFQQKTHVIDDRIAGLVGERDAAWKENQRLRSLYENVVQNQERFGWTINHLLECEDALQMTQAELIETNSEIVSLRSVIDKCRQSAGLKPSPDGPTGDVTNLLHRGDIKNPPDDPEHLSDIYQGR